MKIAQVVCVFPPYKGGIGSSAFYFACELASFGHDVTVFTPDYANKKGNGEFSSFKIIRYKPWFEFGNAAFIPQVFSELEKFDIVHLHYPFFGGAESVVLKRLLNIRPKLIIHYHMDAIGSGAKGAIFDLYRWTVLPAALSAVDLITCASLDYVANSQISAYYKDHQEKFREIAFGVDTEKFKPSESREKSTEKNILFVATLDQAHYFKGLDVLLEAIKKIKENDIKFKLNIVGDGDMRQYYENKARELQIEDIVNFLGKVSDDDLVKNYQKADVFVLPSINKGEAFGLVLLEAMASGLPIVASDLPGVRGVFRDNEQGLLARPNDASDLAEKITSILTNNELADNFGKAGRQLAIEKYNWEKVGEDLDKIYEDLLNK